MKHFLWVLLMVLLAGAAAGCGSDKDKGIKKDKDFPREAPPTTGI
jgi:hypothetical protein